MADRDAWNHDAVQAWQRIFRDVVAVTVGAFMLVWQTVFAVTPNALLIGAGLVALGLPPALRIDEKLRDRISRGDDG